MWVFGYDDIWSSSNGVKWTQVSDNLPWGIRGLFSPAVFKEKIWIMGGLYYYSRNDIWYSYDGVDWIQSAEESDWSPRFSYQSLVFDNKIWIIGGRDDAGDYLNDVWYSSDGVTWTEATDNAEWGILDGYSTAVFQDKMWVMGGYNNTYGSLVGSVWSSTDGAHWSYSGNCGARFEQTSVVAGGGMWLLGGNYGGYWTNGVWSSTDGANWDPANSGVHWTARDRHASVAFDGKIWVLGGLDDYGVTNDVWYAEVFNAHFSGAPVNGYTPLTVQFTDESISVLETITGWLWDFGDGTTSTEQHPSHTYEHRGLYDVSLTVISASNTDTETKTGYIHVTDAEHPYHSADINQDHKISLSELLRVIQFYNLGGLHCAPATEDGYAPGVSPDKGLPPLVPKADLLRNSETKPDCALHSSDYYPPDWSVNMSELLRAIQLFRSPGYHACPDGEDGFCVE